MPSRKKTSALNPSTRKLGFTVDTNLFRELGAMLVGRDSTALAELIKNAYDADAETVTVYGESLSNKGRGFVQIVDDGTGMTLSQFKDGFLRVASRYKNRISPWSPEFRRRVTGAKGIGRLAAHKLAEVMEVESIARADNGQLTSLRATIDWGSIEERETLEDAREIVSVTTRPLRRGHTGTTIRLKRLRRAWTEKRRQAFVRELDSFRPPAILHSPLPKRILRTEPLLEYVTVRDERIASTFQIDLDGDFDVGEEFWKTVLGEASWVIEIDGEHEKEVSVRISPTERMRRDPELGKYLNSKPYDFRFQRPIGIGPTFQSRILYRSGVSEAGRSVPFGVRVYMEGFRVLPYGEDRNDWLSLNADYVRRARGDELDDSKIIGFKQLSGARANQLLAASQRQYFGAVFLTEEGARGLEMLINREGFIPDDTFEALVGILRQSIQLSVRVRAAVDSRRVAAENPPAGGSGKSVKSVESSIKIAQSAVRQAQKEITNTKAVQPRTATTLIEATNHLVSFANGMIARAGQLEILAAVGTLTAGVVHEFGALIGMARGIEERVVLLAEDTVTTSGRTAITRLARAVNDLRQSLEKQAAYLSDIVGVDARRNRSRQLLRGRFDAAIRIYQNALDSRDIEVRNDIPEDAKTVSMFPAELLTVLTNLLSNAIKAAGAGGRIRASASRTSDGDLRLLLENTGSEIDLSESERWFVPFESTTAEIDPDLGQGMGLGLTIVRNVLNEVDARIRFIKARRPFATAVEVTFPK